MRTPGALRPRAAARTEVRKPIPLDGWRCEERFSHLELVRRVVEGGGQQLAVVAPLLVLLAQLELVELLVGNQRLNSHLVEAALLRRVGLEHCENRTALNDGAVEFLE